MCASREAKGTTDALKAGSSTADGNGVPEIARAHDDGLSLRRLIRIGPGTAAGEPHYRCERARPAQPGDKRHETDPDQDQKTASELKAVVEGSIVKLTLPPTMDSEHQRMLNDLQAKDGKDFDRTYDQIQLKAHQDAVALFESYSKNGDNPELKSWAAATLPHLKEHLSMAEKLK